MTLLLFLHAIGSAFAADLLAGRGTSPVGDEDRLGESHQFRVISGGADVMRGSSSADWKGNTYQTEYPTQTFEDDRLDRVAQSIAPLHSYERDRLELVAGSMQGLRVHHHAPVLTYAINSEPEAYYGEEMPHRAHLKMHVHRATPHPTPDLAAAERMKAIRRDADAERALFGQAQVSDGNLEQETRPESQTVGDDLQPSDKPSRGPIDPLDVRADRYHPRTRESWQKPQMDKAAVEELKARARREGRIPDLSQNVGRPGSLDANVNALLEDAQSEDARSEDAKGEDAAADGSAKLTQRGLLNQRKPPSDGSNADPAASASSELETAFAGKVASGALKVASQIPAQILPSADYPFLCPCRSLEDPTCKLEGYEDVNCGPDAPPWEGCALCVWEMFR